ncbi:hypothetical protein ACLE20_15125 [Rhizobium sp. YIM 134829]|uniref:hypothetical protein n=1 Tax=Rhizobium sp. YIM 134829 TaxID=3390453 RepID=UPI003978947E
MLDVREEWLSPSFQKHHIHLGDEVYIVLHRFTEVDTGDPHDHPWSFTTTIAKGSYVEEIFQLDGTSERVLRKRGDSFQVPAGRIHRIVELPEGECVTAVLYGPKEMEFGFYRFEDGRALYRQHDQTEWGKA